MVSPATLAISVLIIVGYSQYAHSFCGETANLATTAGMSIRVGHLAVRASFIKRYSWLLRQGTTRSHLDESEESTGG